MKIFGWNRDSYILISGFFLVLFLLGYIWWPLAEDYLAYINWQGTWWLQIDWLLLGLFFFMSLLIMANADFNRDLKIVFVGLVGGLVIESWGTQTQLWVYYTNERPPLWIIPAWPIASLAIDRIVRGQEYLLRDKLNKFYRWIYAAIFGIFGFFMIHFVWPSFGKSLTWVTTLLCVFLIFTPVNFKKTVLYFLAGVGLGYFLELWGTTRLCWTYYTLEQPPTFAVLAHGMAAVAFWRAGLLLESTIVASKKNINFMRIRITDR